MNLVILGAPGSGKGTQAVEIAKQLGIPHISTGEVFRGHIKNHTELGARVKAFTTIGELVPDEIVFDVVSHRLEQADCHKIGFLLDGYPRTVAQAKTLCDWLEKEAMPLDYVIELNVTPAVLVRRLGGRRSCAKCGVGYNVEFKPPRTEGRCDACGGELVTRADDSHDAISRRLELDAALARPLHQYYEAKDIFISVDGDKDPATITAAILARLAA